MKATSRVGIRRSNLIQVIPTANKFEILVNMNDSNLTECLTSVLTTSNVTSDKFKKKDQKKTQQLLQKTQGNNKPERRRQRISLLGDSHARKCATDLQHNLGHDHEFTSFVNPGAAMEEIVHQVRVSNP